MRQIENHKFDLVIFDCDGVLVDSEVISCRAHAEVLSRHGYPITEQQVLERFLGVSDREARLIIETEIGRRLPADFEAQVKHATLRFYAGDLRAISYVDEAIAAIDLPKCVASSGTPREDTTWPHLYGALRQAHAAYFLGFTSGQRQARAGLVFVCRSTDEGAAPAMPRDRGQPSRRRRRSRRRNDCARLSWRQPLPTWVCRDPTSRRRRHDI